jgi:hypothetical protein
MTTFGLNDLYESAEQGAPIGLPDGNYDLEVVDARPRAESRLIFIDFNVLSGPSIGKNLSANLYIPSQDQKGAQFHFRKKVRGFLSPQVKAAFQLADGAPDFADALDIIADALPGAKLNANVLLVKEGKYKGNNELQDSSPLEGAVTAPAPTQAAPAAPAEAPAPVAEAAPAAAEPQPAAVPF